jgi:hypothetical protein
VNKFENPFTKLVVKLLVDAPDDVKPSSLENWLSQLSFEMFVAVCLIAVLGIGSIFFVCLIPFIDESLYAFLILAAISFGLIACIFLAFRLVRRRLVSASYVLNRLTEEDIKQIALTLRDLGSKLPSSPIIELCELDGENKTYAALLLSDNRSNQIRSIKYIAGWPQNTTNILGHLTNSLRLYESLNIRYQRRDEVSSLTAKLDTL